MKWYEVIGTINGYFMNTTPLSKAMTYYRRALEINQRNGNKNLFAG